MASMLSVVARVISDAVALVESGRSREACELLRSVLDVIGSHGEDAGAQ